MMPAHASGPAPKEMAPVNDRFTVDVDNRHTPVALADRWIVLISLDPTFA